MYKHELALQFSQVVTDFRMSHLKNVFLFAFKLLRVLNSHPSCGDLLEHLLRQHPDQHRVLISFIRRLVVDSRTVVVDGNVVSETEKEDCESFYSSLEAWDLVRRSRLLELGSVMP